MNDRCCDHAANGDPHVCGEGEPCPQGCGGLTFDPYGGPCQRCWDAAPSRCSR